MTDTHKASSLKEVDYRFRVTSTEGDAFFDSLVKMPSGELPVGEDKFQIGQPKFAIESDRYFSQRNKTNGHMSLKLRTRLDSADAKSFDEVGLAGKSRTYAVVKFRDEDSSYEDHAAASEFFLGRVQEQEELQMDVKLGRLVLDGHKWDIVEHGNQTIGMLLGEHGYSNKADDYDMRFELEQKRVIREIFLDGKPVARIHMDDVNGKVKSGFRIFELEVMGDNIEANKTVNEVLNNWLMNQPGVVPESRSKEEIENLQLSAENSLQKETVWHEKLAWSLKNLGDMLKRLVGLDRPS